MPKLPVVSPKRLISFLEKKGFEVHRTAGSHIILLRKTDKRRAVVPFHRKDLPKGTLLAILKSAGITKKEWTSIS